MCGQADVVLHVLTVLLFRRSLAVSPVPIADQINVSLPR
jgi:hypothetical protein